MGLKLKKIGPFTVLVYFAFNLIVSKYWELLLGGIEIGGQEVAANVPDLMVTFPAILMTSFAFWAKTRQVDELQKSILNFIINTGRTSFKFLFINFLGFPANDMFFRSRSRNPFLLVRLFFKVLFKNLFGIGIRTMFVAFVIKFCGRYFYDNFDKFVPTFKEIILFPLIIIRFILVHSYRFITRQLLGDE